MAKLILILSTIFFTAALTSYSQSPIISPTPGNYTVCPGERITYSVIPGPNFRNCTSFAWTVSNGSFSSTSSVTSTTTTSLDVDVFWNDSPSTGTLTVSATGCTEGPFTKSSTYAIRSLTGRVPQNLRYNQLQPYCSTIGIHLAVDVMFLENTGGTTGITQQRADGYEWTLPSGWKYNGSGGTVRTPQEFIYIEPDNGCVGGSVTVKAYKDCSSGRKYSSSASVSINRPTPSITVTPPSGYTGPSCGAVQPVTFTVTPISCASTYTWVFNGPDANTPTGWLSSPGPVVTNTNYITVTPSGTTRDAGSIQVTANLDCGTQLTAITYNLDFQEPQIIGPSLICSTGSYSVQNATGAQVNWLSSNTNILTINSSGEASRVRSSWGEVELTATLSCDNLQVKRKIWVGQPYPEDFRIVNYQGTSENWEICPGTVYTFKSENHLNPYYTNNFNWQITNGTIHSGQGTRQINASWPNDNSLGILSLTLSNSCGSGASDGAAFLVSCGSMAMMVYPNPADAELNVVIADNSEEEKKSDYEIVLLDNEMRQVYRNSTKNKNIKFSTEKLKNGIYFIHLRYSGGILKQQVIISR